LLTEENVRSTALGPTHQEKVQKITAFVQAARDRIGVTPTRKKQFEPSALLCNQGEGYIHLNSLIVSDHTDHWTTLLDPAWGEAQCDDIIGAFSMIS
jgi:hypothetical protein